MTHAVARGFEPPPTLARLLGQIERNARSGRRNPAADKRFERRLLAHDQIGRAAGLLRRDSAPAIVFEAEASQLAAAGTSYRALLEANGGYRVWSLRTEGLRPEPEGAAEPGSFNVLALREDLLLHRRVVEKLRGALFPANQNA